MRTLVLPPNSYVCKLTITKYFQIKLGPTQIFYYYFAEVNTGIFLRLDPDPKSRRITDLELAKIMWILMDPIFATWLITLFTPISPHWYMLSLFVSQCCESNF